MSLPEVTSPSGFSMPAVGFGTWQATDEVLLEAAVHAALETGYRHIDTAEVYENEHVIGNVLKEWFDSGRLQREDIFITTKLPAHGMKTEDVSKYIDASLAKLQVKQLDLYLVHLPMGATIVNKTFVADMSSDMIAVWKEMEKQVDAKKTRFIGVSNFNIKQIGRVLDIARIAPVTNQVELHLYLQQNELVDYLKKNNITTTAYSSLGTPGSEKMFQEKFGVKVEVPKILENPTVLEIAKKHGRTPAQVLLRQILQRGIVVIPKSTTPKRIKENFEIKDWTLDDEDMVKLAAENRNFRILEFKNIFANFGDHPEYPF